MRGFSNCGLPPSSNCNGLPPGSKQNELSPKVPSFSCKSFTPQESRAAGQFLPPPAAAQHLEPATAPRLSLEAGGSKLDEMPKDLDGEIKTLLAYWGCWSQMEDKSLGTSPQSKDLESSSSSSHEQDSSKPYNLPHQSTIVRYAQEAEKNEDGSANNEGRDAEEETEEMEADARPLQNAPQRENRPTVPHCSPCPESEQKFSDSRDMQKHLHIHKRELPYGCQFCGKAFSDASNLAKHQQCHMCSQGPKAFYSKGKLDAHLRRPQGTHPFSCPHCEKGYFSQVELDNHIKVHAVTQEGGHPPGQLLCKGCDRTCASKRRLHPHQLAHFVCKVCGESFTHKFAYEFHKAFHQNHCEYCGVAGIHICQGVPQAKSRILPPAGSCTQSDAGPLPKVSSRSTTLASGQPLSQATVASPAKSAPHFVPVSVVNSSPELLPITLPLSGLGSAQPVAGTLAQPRPTALVLGQPSLQTVVSFPAFPVPQFVPVLVNSGPEMVNLTLPLNGLGSAPSSNRSPAKGAAKKNLILLKVETLPQGIKVIQIPDQKIMSTVSQTCPHCQTKYLGKHNCNVSRS